MKKAIQSVFKYLLVVTTVLLLFTGCGLVDDEVTINNGVDGDPVAIKP